MKGYIYIFFFKDGELIVATERHFFIAENQLIIIVDSVHNDSGIYECHLNNSQGEEVGRSRVVVKPSKIYFLLLNFNNQIFQFSSREL